MDLNSFTRRRSSKPEDIEQLLAQNSKMQAKRFGSNAITFTKIFAYCLVVLPILFVISLIFRHSSDRTMGFADARVLENREVKQNVTPVGEGGLGGVLFQHADKYNGKLLGGLLADGFDETACASRVLLVDQGKDMADLFCEPFPDKSWLLPRDFPLIDQFDSLNQNSPNCHGNMLKNNVINSSAMSKPSYIYLHLVHDYGDHDKLFFCDGDQSFLENVPWLIMKTDNYYVPFAFLDSIFRDRTEKLIS
ncbi:hypothetical protein OIU85_006274 [Salix viminalis]|uniref:Fucosyltransferase n=1 Tax=Salix viminalis TaxID=40686 RepID=A0A9Q0PKM2_SALVM|nr:hypothetical protein OIU85_006274 [Salix viminalis]